MQELRNLQRVKVEPEWKLARCIVGETSRENSGEKSAAKFLSDSETDNCCRIKRADSQCFSHDSVQKNQNRTESLVVLFRELSPR